MMRQYELVERVQRYDPSADEALLNRAYVYAMQVHGHQKRASGAPYFCCTTSSRIPTSRAPTSTRSSARKSARWSRA